MQCITYDKSRRCDRGGSGDVGDGLEDDLRVGCGGFRRERDTGVVVVVVGGVTVDVGCSAVIGEGDCERDCCSFL